MANAKKAPPSKRALINRPAVTVSGSPQGGYLARVRCGGGFRIIRKAPRYDGK